MLGSQPKDGQIYESKKSDSKTVRRCESRDSRRRWLDDSSPCPPQCKTNVDTKSYGMKRLNALGVVFDPAVMLRL